MYPKGTNTLSRWTRDSRGGMETTFSLMLFHPSPKRIIIFVKRYFSYEYTLEGIAVEACEGGEGGFGVIFSTFKFYCGKIKVGGRGRGG